MSILGTCRGSIQVYLLLVVASTVSACGEVATQVKIEGADTPVFTLSGSGNLASFTISRLPPDGELRTRDQVKLAWKVVPQSGYFSGDSLRQIGNLTYGKVPPGYKQIFPEGDAPPEPITAGTTYSFYCVTTNAPHARGLFTLTGGKAVRLNDEVPCFADQGNESVRVPCAH